MYKKQGLDDEQRSLVELYDQDAPKVSQLVTQQISVKKDLELNLPLLFYFLKAPARNELLLNLMQTIKRVFDEYGYTDILYAAAFAFNKLLFSDVSVLLYEFRTFLIRTVNYKRV